MSDVTEKYREGGFLHAAQWHADHDAQDEAAKTYEVSKSTLIEDIAQHNWDFVNNTSPSTSDWDRIDNTDANPWRIEASLLYQFLLDQGWTPPTI